MSVTKIWVIVRRVTAWTATPVRPTPDARHAAPSLAASGAPRVSHASPTVPDVRAQSPRSVKTTRGSLGATSTTPRYPAQAWLLEAINVGTAWTAGITGEGVNIFILDSGVDVTHPDLLGKHVVAGSASNQQTDPTADDHGTVTASLAVGAANNSDCGVGVTFDATFSMGIFSDSDQLTAGVDSGVVHVHSNSWGVDSCTYDDDVEGTVQYWASSDACPFDGSSE